MKYIGKDEKSAECCEYLKKECVIKRKIGANDAIEITIYKKDSNEFVAYMAGFLYDFKLENVLGKNQDAFHIKKLTTNDAFLQRGFATFLVKEAIMYAEHKNVKCITADAFADTNVIPQEDLEIFYKNFTFEYKTLGFTKEKEIEFKVILD